MDPIDLEIQRRLEKLKENEATRHIPSVDELHKRLKDLKDLPSTPASSIVNKYVLFPKSQSNQEQVDNIIKQFSEEVNLSTGPTSACPTSSLDEIEKRLQNLKSRNQEPVPSNANYTPKESDTKILLKKILAEAELEKKTEEKFPYLVQKSVETAHDQRMDLSDSEDEFCSICEKYPQWICLNCDRDVFCTKCFKEYHDDMGECHQRKPFVRQRKPSSDSDYSD